jgi:hypothetical protein
VGKASDVREIEIHAAKPSVSVPSPLETGIAIAKLKKKNCLRPLQH